MSSTIPNLYVEDFQISISRQDFQLHIRLYFPVANILEEYQLNTSKMKLTIIFTLNELIVCIFCLIYLDQVLVYHIN